MRLTNPEARLNMAKLGGFFGPHNGSLKIYVWNWPIGSGTFNAFNDFDCKFAGSYNAMGQSGTLVLGLVLTDRNPTSASGPCTVTLNDRTDSAARYQSSGQKLTITTTLNGSPLDIYPSESGTQIDNISDHNVWIGPHA